MWPLERAAIKAWSVGFPGRTGFLRASHSPAIKSARTDGRRGIFCFKMIRRAAVSAKARSANRALRPSRSMRTMHVRNRSAPLRSLRISRRRVLTWRSGRLSSPSHRRRPSTRPEPARLRRSISARTRLTVACFEHARKARRGASCVACPTVSPNCPTSARRPSCAPRAAPDPAHLAASAAPNYRPRPRAANVALGLVSPAVGLVGCTRRRGRAPSGRAPGRVALRWLAPWGSEEDTVGTRG